MREHLNNRSFPSLPHMFSRMLSSQASPFRHACSMVLNSTWLLAFIRRTGISQFCSVSHSKECTHPLGRMIVFTIFRCGGISITFLLNNSALVLLFVVTVITTVKIHTWIIFSLIFFPYLPFVKTIILSIGKSRQPHIISICEGKGILE